MESQHTKHTQHAKPILATASLLWGAIVCCLGQTSQVQAQAKESKLQNFYYDGSQRIELIVEEGVVAEFRSSPTLDARQSLVKKADSSAESFKQAGVVTLWKTNAPEKSLEAGKIQSKNFASKEGTSPVFRMGGKGGQILALAGNIVVEFEPSWTQTQVENFLASKGLRIERKLELVGRNYYEVQTPPGLTSLNQANALVGQPGVLSSSPNWWRDVVAK